MFKKFKDLFSSSKDDSQKKDKKAGVEQATAKKGQKTVGPKTVDDMTLQDFADQLGMLSKMGLGSIAQQAPGGKKLSPEELKKGEQELAQFRVIIVALTPEERQDPRILDDERKQRAARTAGVTVADIDSLLKRFKQMKQYAKLLKRFGGFKGMFSR